MSDPSFLLPPKVEEPKTKTKKQTQKVATDSNKSTSNVVPQTIKKYTQSKLKNDTDAIVKKIDKLKDAINKHDETKVEMKKALQDLEIKKLELEELKAQI